MALLVTVPSVCALVGWLRWLRLVRHFHDRSGPEAVRHLPAVARAYRAPQSVGDQERSGELDRSANRRVNDAVNDAVNDV